VAAPLTWKCCSTVCLAMQRAFTWLDRATLVHPWKVKCSTGACLALVGDISAQCIEGTPLTEMDFLRSFKMVLWRSVVSTPAVNIWYKVLETRVPGASTAAIMKKVGLDQVLASPILHSLFWPFMVVCDGGGPKDAWERLRCKFVPLMKMNYCFWPAVSSLTFSIVPIRHRVVWVNCWSAVWMGCLSSMNAR